MRRFILLFAVFCTLTFLLAGCWDSRDIEKRGFVVGVGIDLLGEQKDGEYNLSITSQFVVPKGMGGNSEGGSSSPQKSYVNVTADSDSIFLNTRKVDTKTSKIPYFEQLKVLAVSEEAAKKEELFASVMDFFLREHEMRRGVRVVITAVTAKELLEIDPGQGEKIPALYIDTVMSNVMKSMAVAKPVRLGDVHEYLLGKSSYVIPLLLVKEKNMSDIGVAVFSGYNDKMVGTLNESETVGLNFVTGNAKEGAVTFELNKHVMGFKVLKTKPKVKINTDNPSKMDIAVNIKVEGEIVESFGHKSLLNEENINKMEKAVADKIKKMVEKTVKKAQNDLQTDVFGFSYHLKHYHYDVWKKVEDEWDHGNNLFSTSNITVTVDTTIRTVGATNKVKN